MGRRLLKGEAGQALVEFAMVATTLVVFTLGIIDFGRAIYDVEVMKNLVGEGSSLASRGSEANLATYAQTVVNDGGSDLNLGSNGCVIITVITNEGGGSTPTLTITGQAKNCGITANSKIGCLQGVNGCQSSTPTLPTYASTALGDEPTGSSMAVTEIYYNFSTITPITSLLGSAAVPSQFYSVAYY
jgi:Flp pilus assembly protein TadG